MKEEKKEFSVSAKIFFLYTENSDCPAFKSFLNEIIPKAVDGEPHVEELLGLDVVDEVDEVLEGDGVGEDEVEGHVRTGLVWREGLGRIVRGSSSAL